MAISKEQLDIEINRTESRFFQLEQVIEGLNMAIRNLLNSSTLSLIQIKNLNSQIQAFQQKINELESSLGTLNKTLKDMSPESQNKIIDSELSARLSEITQFFNNRFDILGKAVLHTSRELSSLEKSTGEGFQEMRDQFQKVEERFSEMGERIGKVEEDVAEIKADIVEIKADIVEMGQGIKTIINKLNN